MTAAIVTFAAEPVASTSVRWRCVASSRAEEHARRENASPHRCRARRRRPWGRADRS